MKFMTELADYNRKRNFEKTIEPEGETTESSEGLRFVVQHHLARKDHYDFRLEHRGVLLSWAVPKGPSYNTRDKRLAIQVEDHPLEYRNFEGTIPKGEYGGGVVMLWDEGFWEPLGSVEESLSKGAIKFVLNGRRLKGKWALVRLKKKADEEKDNWLLLKERDEYVKTTDGIGEFITSVRTGRTMEEIEKGSDDRNMKNPFSSAEIQLAKLAKTVPNGENWLYEMKYDGYRILAYIEGSSVQLITRNGNDYTGRFRSIAASLADWANGRAMILDGEMTVTDDKGKTDFQALQNYMKSPGEQRLTYIVFDLLALEGKDLRGQSLIKRKEALEALMKEAPNNLWYSRHVIGNGKESFAAACKLGMEGIVGKKVESVYSGTRNGDWIKLKCDKRQEFVIGGYTLSDKKTSGLSSLLLGAYEGDDLVYVGRTGTGFSEAEAKRLEKELRAIQSPYSPFKAVPKAKSNERFTWVEPSMVAEVKFAELTKENLLRQASYKGLRTDKSPKDVKMEIADKEEEQEEEIAQEAEEADIADNWDRVVKAGMADKVHEAGEVEKAPEKEETAKVEQANKGDNRENEDKIEKTKKAKLIKNVNKVEQTNKTDKTRETEKVDKADKAEKTDTDTTANVPSIDIPADNIAGRSPKTGKSDLTIAGVRVTHPDKVLFDDTQTTKEDVIRYYEKVSQHMLPYTSHRILSIVRCPKGVSQTCFYKKHSGPDTKGVVTIAVPTDGGEKENYFYIENALGLITEAQMGTLEFHIWGSRIDKLDKPDVMVFDLDPDEGMDLGRVRQGVKDLKSILAELSLNSYLKTSGGKGYHVVVPFTTVASWDVFRNFARRVAEVMEQKWPDRYTSNVRKAKRTDKIFIDWIRNTRGATSIAPYSLRARKGAKVSMPIAWDELNDVSPDGVDMSDALRRIMSVDPWKDFFLNDQKLI